MLCIFVPRDVSSDSCEQIDTAASFALDAELMQSAAAERIITHLNPDHTVTSSQEVILKFNFFY